MISPRKCLGCPPFLEYICWPNVVGALLLLSAPLSLLSFRRAWQQECNFGGRGLGNTYSLLNPKVVWGSGRKVCILFDQISNTFNIYCMEERLYSGIRKLKFTQNFGIGHRGTITASLLKHFTLLYRWW